MHEKKEKPRASLSLELPESRYLRSKYKTDKQLIQTIRQIHQRLKNEYETRFSRRKEDPLEVLILTILSQQTNWQNARKTYRELRLKFPRWDMLLDADVTQVESAIKKGGLGRVKARHIQRVVQTLHKERGKVGLGFLRRKNTKEALRFLMGLPGVGEKTARCVLLFSLGRPVFPVDRHVRRICERLGWIHPRSSMKRTHEVLEIWIPEDLRHDLHLNLVDHGRRICHPKEPRCPKCVIRRYCNYYSGEVENKPQPMLAEQRSVCKKPAYHKKKASLNQG